LGNGPEFRGVFDRRTKQVHLFERVPGGAYQAPVKVASLDDPIVKEKLTESAHAEACEQLAMLDGAGHPFDLEAVRAGKQTPVYFGSAVNNFGIQLLLDGFLHDSVPPQPRHNGDSPLRGAARETGQAVEDTDIPVTYPKFSGFIFKIQANMDPKHRDRIAFLRICSGKFERDMNVIHERTGKTVRLSSSHKLFGQERATVDEAWPGDVLGLVGHDAFGIGDTLAEERGIVFNEIPRFPPEVFVYISNPSPADAKKFRAGLEQLLQEGVVQSFTARYAPPGATLLAAVGPLQFEVVQYRLKSEYNAESRLEQTPWTLLRWVDPHPSLDDLRSIIVASGVSFGTDKNGQPVVLFPNDWTLRYFIEKNPDLKLRELPPDFKPSE
jgi:peptide chain release factor 3